MSKIKTDILFRLEHLAWVMLFFTLNACSILERSSDHQFSSGYYKVKPAQNGHSRIYGTIESEQISIYASESDSGLKKLKTLYLLDTGELCHYPMVFSKQSLDIDITTILLKYRPSIKGLPAQMSVDFNAAIYAGWRFDHYYIKSKTDPLGKCRYKTINRGFDFGIFAGPGTTVVNPFSTRGIVVDEYNGMILQYGLAGFLESDVASFGFAVGSDYLVGPDSKNWIYTHKPWLGFIVGIALN